MSGARLGSSTSSVLSGATARRDRAPRRWCSWSRDGPPGRDRGHDTRSVGVPFVGERRVRPSMIGPQSVRATMPRCASDRCSARSVVVARAGRRGLAARPRPVAAHGPAPAEPPTLANLLLGWTFEPLPTLAIGVALGWWWWAVRRVDAAHPANPVPRRRTVAFVAGHGRARLRAPVRASTATTRRSSRSTWSSTSC